jgi:hypothetical protein
MKQTGGPYLLAALCVLVFILAQTFQELSFRFWIPASKTLQDDLLTHLLTADQVRALAVMGSILLLALPFTVVALRYREIAPIASTLGLIFAAAFIGFEISDRSIDFFVIGRHWAHQFQDAAGPERETLLRRFALWNEIVEGWYFPLMLSYLLSSCLFAFAVFKDKDSWRGVATIAFSLNALRLLGRILSTFAGQTWLAGLNDSFYFPAVATINLLLFAWFLHLARCARTKRRESLI